MSRVAVVCRAYGLRPIDGPFGDFTDVDGYLASARRAAVLGYEGKWAIHPSQVPLANQVFTPDADLVNKTHRIIAAMEDAAAYGKGAVSPDGRGWWTPPRSGWQRRSWRSSSKSTRATRGRKLRSPSCVGLLGLGSR